MQQLKKLLYLILLLPAMAWGQNTTTLPTPTTSYTPQFRYFGTAADTLKQVWVYSGSKYNRWYTATEMNKYFLTKSDTTRFLMAAKNGLSVNSGFVKLGGDLTEDTYVSTGTSNISISGDNGGLTIAPTASILKSYKIDGTSYNVITNSSGDYFTGLSKVLPTDKSTLVGIDTAGAFVLDGINNRGLTARGNYEPNYTSKSYISKRYADSLAAAISAGISGNYVAKMPSGFGANVTGVAGQGFVQLPKQSASPNSSTDNLRIYADSLNRLSWKNSTYRRTIRVTRPSDMTISMPYRLNSIVADSTDVANVFARKDSVLFKRTTPNYIDQKVQTDTLRIGKVYPEYTDDQVQPNIRMGGNVNIVSTNNDQLTITDTTSYSGTGLKNIGTIQFNSQLTPTKRGTIARLTWAQTGNTSDSRFGTGMVYYAIHRPDGSNAFPLKVFSHGVQLGLAPGSTLYASYDSPVTAFYNGTGTGSTTYGFRITKQDRSKTPMIVTASTGNVVFNDTTANANTVWVNGTLGASGNITGGAHVTQGGTASQLVTGTGTLVTALPTGTSATTLALGTANGAVANAQFLDNTIKNERTNATTLNNKVHAPANTYQTPPGTAGTDSVVVKNALGLRAVSPTYYAPTANPSFTNTTTVQGFRAAYKAVTAATTFGQGDFGVNVTSGTFTQALPATPFSGQIYGISNSGTGVVTVTATGMSGLTSVILNQGDWLMVQFTGVSGVYDILSMSRALIAGNGIGIVQSNNTYTISATGNPVVEISGTSQAASGNTVYIPHNAALTTLTVPTTTTIGTLYQIIGEGSGGWKVQLPTGAVAVGVGGFTTTSAGSLSSTDRYCTLTIRYASTNKFVVTTSQGTITPL